MSDALRISADLALPLEAVTETFALIPAITEVHGAGRGLLRLSPGEVEWALERAARRTETRGCCWEWTGYERNGYGTISIRNSPVYLHALSFAISGRALEEGEEVCHTCDNRPCWHPRHLFAGTRLDNVADMWAKGRAIKPPRMVGVEQHLARLTDDEVAEIRAAWDAGGVEQRTLAAAYGCSQSTIWRLVNGKVRV